MDEDKLQQHQLRRSIMERNHLMSLAQTGYYLGSLAGEEKKMQRAKLTNKNKFYITSRLVQNV